MKKMFLFIGMLLMFAVVTNAQNVAKRAVKLTPVMATTLSDIKANNDASTTNTNVVIPAKRCLTAEAYEAIMQNDPTYAAQREQFIAEAEAWAKNNPNYDAKTTYTIPIVVHIIYKLAAENISDARVTEQINATNADYAGTNTHSMHSFASSLKANANISFCLAQRDPNGNATTGITRTLTTKTSFNITGSAANSTGYPERSSTTGGCNAWDVTKYFNVWVCNAGSSLCGISLFPTSPISNFYGTTINYPYFGLTGASAPFNLGGTFSHESGHCLNLYHIWGDDGSACTGTDQVADTPGAQGNNYGNVEDGSLHEYDASGNVISTATVNTTTKVEIDNCTTASPGVMYENFMDYTDDIDYANFTPGQVSRMVATLAGADASLTTSNGCTPVTSTPTLTLSTTTLTGFTYVLGSGPSASQTYNLSGTNLTGFPSNITVTAPTHYEVSKSSGSGYAASVTVAYTSATLASTPIYVRLKAGLAVASYNSELVANAGGGATTVNVTCSGSVTATATPTLTLSTTTLSGFTYVTGNGPSASQSYNLSGTNLTGFPSNITVTAPTHYEVSKTSGSGYATSVTVAYTSATLASTPIYVRLKAGLAVASYNSELVSNAGGGATTVNVTCSGSVTSGTTTTNCTDLYPPSALLTCGDTLTYYKWTSPNGYVNGNDAYGDLEMTQKYINTSSGILDTVYAALKAIKNPTAGSIYCKIYSIDATTKAPSSVLATSNAVAYSSISTTGGYVTFTFPSPPAITGNFAASIVLPTGTGDTMVVYSTKITCHGNDSLSWEWDGSAWYAFKSQFSAQGYNFDFAIYPVICTTSVGFDNLISDKDVTVYPNPTQNEFTVDFSGYKPTDATIEVYNMIGKLVKSASSNGLTDKMSIDMVNQASGIYIVNIKTQQGTVIKKLSLIK
jgi:hypothetical protein